MNRSRKPAGGRRPGRIESLQRLTIAASLAGLPVMLGLPMLVGADLLFCRPALAQTRLPVAALPSTPTTVYGTANTYATKGSALTITQTAPTSIVSWKSFDIGTGASVNIVQPSSSAVILNKVSGGAILNQTTIDGMLNANGRVYISNPNGIVFGKTGVVNVNTLVASTLKFDESRVIGGFLQPGALPLLGAEAGLLPGSVLVEGDGTTRARLTAANGGLILLAGPSVINNGVLSAPDGQVMLAAGSKVYLAAPQVSQTGTSLRGLLVEVSNDSAVVNGAVPTVGTSLAENGLTGTIDVARGNATMIGYAVNQKGLVSASTSVNLNGSIYLTARDQAVRPDANNPYKATRSGKLVLGEGSVTQILPVLDDTSTIAPSVTFNKSDVKLNGANIVLESNARIIAPGGNVTIKAERLTNPADAVTTVLDPVKDIVRVDLAAGSSIDVSGSVSVADTLDAAGNVVKAGTQLAMESNVITVDLRGTELADNVVLRTSSLYGTKVQVDVRKGMTAANVAGYLNLVEHGLTELNSAGGTVNIAADGAIIQRAGSTINVDGGYVDYKSGYVNTTKFQLNDKLVDVGAAQSGVLYTGAVNVANGADNYEAGYRQGASAGSVKFSAPVVVMQGTLSGQATAGARQRVVSASSYPLGGQLQIGNVSSETVDTVSGKAKVGLADQFGFTGKLVFGSGTSGTSGVAPAVGAAFDLTIADQRQLTSLLTLDTGMLARAGFSRIVALTSGSIEVDAPVTLAAGGKLWLGAGQGTLAGADGTLAAGGTISINAPVTIAGGSMAATASGGLLVADGVAIDLAGRWSNDRSAGTTGTDLSRDPTGPVALNGGTLTMAASLLKMGNDVSVDVSAGAWNSLKNVVTKGSAGSITLQADPVDALLPAAASLQFGTGLTLSGYGFGSGGKLKLVGRTVSIGPVSTSADPLDLLLQPVFFQQGGFTSYDIAGNLNVALLANTIVKPQARSWQLASDASQRASGLMGNVATSVMFDLAGPASVRPTTNVTLRALAQLGNNVGELTVNEGAQLVMDPGASMTLLAGEQLTVLGTLSAPGGQISLGLTPTAGIVPFDATRSIWFGANSRVLATGSAQRMSINADGVATGDMLDGGSIRVGTLQSGLLSAATGFVVAESGALFDVSGISAGKLHLKSGSVAGGGITPLQDVAGNGGSIEIRAREGLLFAGTLKGGSGGSNATGGALTIALDAENQSGSSYPGDERVLTIASQMNSIVPIGLLPGQPIVFDQFGTGLKKDVDLGWFITGTIPASVTARHAGEGFILDSAFSSGGFGRLTFKSQNVLAFGLANSALTLSAREALILDAPVLRADRDRTLTTYDLPAGNTLTLNAPYLQLGNTDQRYQVNTDAPVTASTGNASIKANGTTIDLIGNSTLQGFGTASLSAAADIRLVGIASSNDDGSATGFAPGALSMVGNLKLTDAQTYPTTLSDFTFKVAPSSTIAPGISNPGTGKLTFASNGNVAEPVLSVGGSITAYAADIIQGGRLVAPFGAISLGNLDSSVSSILTESVSFLNGSVTSVAGSGSVPFGTIVNGSVATASNWTTSLTDGTLVSIKANPVAGGSVPERALPTKTILSSAKTVAQSSEAVLDVSGGGSLFAYEFTPGKGGSVDVLAKSATATKTTVFAINPNFNGSVAPIDGSYGSDGGLAAGNSVTLSAMPGLAAGTYTLLPAHYALLPGGFSITVAANTGNMQSSSNIVLNDGSMLVAGRLAESGSGSASTRSTGFVVSSSAVINSKSEYTISDASTYFKAKSVAAGIAAPALPVDGGNLSFHVTGSTDAALVLDGTIRLGAATGGRAGDFAVAAPAITIVADRNQATANSVRLVADKLTGLGASSLLLGALADPRSDGMHLNYLARTVTLANNAQHALAGSNIVLAASEAVRLSSGADLQGSGVPARESQDILLDGPGALLRVSGGAQVAIERTTTATTGQLDIASGARVSATGSAYLDATGNVTLNGLLNLMPGTAWSFGAPQISFGTAIPRDGSVAGLMFDGAALAALGTLSQLSFNSYAGAIGLYGTVDLGNSAMRSLSLKGAGFRSAGIAGNAAFAAQTVLLEGSGASTTVAPASAAAGTLSVTASEIDIGDQAFALRGYSDSVLHARRQLSATGAAGVLATDHNLRLEAGRIATASGAGATFLAGGNLVMTDAVDPQAQLAAPGLGGQLRFEAATVTSDALIAAPSGQVTLIGTNGVNVTGGLITTAGTGTVFGSTTAYAPGGQITLAGSSVVVGANAVLDVSAIGAAAGTLSIYAAGSVLQLDGTLRGGALAGIDGLQQLQGQFVLSAGQASGNGGFGVLNQKLNASGFTHSRRFDFFNGDVVLGGTDNIRAHEVVIAADNGNITIGGNAVIDASNSKDGTKGGSITLVAAQADAAGSNGRVTLDGNALLLASATAPASTDESGSTGNGGSVVIGSANRDGSDARSVNGGASISLNGGTIDVGGSTVARNGSVTLRAPRVGNDVAIASLGTTILNSAVTAIEGTRVYAGSTITEAADSVTNLNATSSGKMYTDAASFGGNSAAILARLNNSSASVRAGIEVRAPDGNLTVSVNEFAASAADRGWNLDAWRFNAQPVALTLRAKGDLRLIGSISDGFVKPANSALSMPDWQLGTDDSASLKLVGGADFSAANVLATVAGSGDVLVDFAARTPTSAAPLTATDAPVALVRTGSGRIDVAAGRDINLGMAGFFTNADGTPVIYDKVNSDSSYKVALYGATIYTAGKASVLPDASVFTAPQNLLNTHFGADGKTLTAATFAKGGGAVSLVAGRDINGPLNLSSNWFYRNADGVDAVPADTTTRPVTPAEPAIPGTKVMLPTVLPQLVNDWLFRQGRTAVDVSGNTIFETLGDGTRLNTAWWARTDYFDHGVATLGGGDLSVIAGRNINNLAASVASNAYAVSTGAGGLKEQGGGDLAVRAGGDIAGGSYYVQKGTATLHADGSVKAGDYAPIDATGSIVNTPLKTILAVGDARFDVSAGRNVAIETSYNPMLTEQSINNVVAGNSRFGAIYGVGGGGARWDVTDLTQDSIDYRQKYAQFSNFSTYGSSSAINLTSIGGDLLLSNNAAKVAMSGVTDIPNALGTSFPKLYVLAPPTVRAVALSGDLTSENGFTMMPGATGQLDLLAAGTITLNNGANGAIRMLDNDPATMSTASAPRIFTPTDFKILNGTSTGIAAHVIGGLHTADTQPVRVIAKAGDIIGDASQQTTLAVPKQVEILAGRDIVDLGLSIQHNSADAVSSIVAGRDFIDQTQSRGVSGEASPVANVVTGAGRIDITAGRNIDFGNGSGLVTRGNIDNPYLAEGGASINLSAGGAKVDYAAFVAYANKVGSVLDVPATELPALLAVTGLPADTSAIDAWIAFRKLDATAQATFLSAHPAIAGRLAASAGARTAALAKMDKSLLNSLFYTMLVADSRSKNLSAFDSLIASLYPVTASTQAGDIALFSSQLKTEQGGSIDLFAPTGSVYAGLTTGVQAANASKQGIFTIRGGSIASLVKTDFLVNQGRVFTLGGGDITLVSQYGNIDAGRGAKTASSAPPPLITIDANGNIKVDVSGSISGSGIATLKTRPGQPDSNVYPVAPRGIFDAGDAGVRSTGTVDVVASVVLNAANISATGAVSGASAAVAAPALASPAAPANAAPRTDDVARAATSPDAAGGTNSVAVDVLGYGEDECGNDDANDTDDARKKKKDSCKK